MSLRSRRYGWYVLLLLAVLNLLNYATRNVVVTMYPDLRVAFGFDNTQLGWMTSSFMLGHAIMNIPFGWLADRFDRRKVLAMGAAVWSLANLGSAVADGFGGAIISRVLAGVGTASCVPIANALLCDVFPAREKARTVALLNVGLFLGGAVGVVLGEELGYPMAFVAVAAPGFIVAALVSAVDVPPAREAALISPLTRSWSLHGVTEGIRAILRISTMRRMIAGAVFASFAAGGYLTWFADFLEFGKGFERREAMLILGAIGLSGGLAGVVSGGMVADRFYRTRKSGRLLGISLGFFFAVPCALITIYVSRGISFYLGAWFLMYFINWYHGPMAAAVDDLVDDRQAALAQASFIFMMHLLGTTTAPVVVGALVDGVGIQHALLAPTAAVLLAAIMFAWSCSSSGHAQGKTC